MHFAKWLEEMLSTKKMTQAELAYKTGISQSTISRWLNGERAPDIHKIRKIGKALGITEQEAFIAAGILRQDIFSVDEEVTAIPILAASIPCGTPDTEFSSYIVGYEKFSHSFFRCCPKNFRDNGLRLFIVRAKGDSMIGKGIVEGSLVIFSPDLQVNHGDIAIVELEDEGLCIKEVLFQDSATILKSANPAYDPMIIINKPLRIIGKVMMHIGYL